MLNTRSMKGNTVHRHASVNQLRPACTQTDLRCTAASTKSQKVATPKTNLDLLLSLDEDISGAPVMNASAGGKGNNQMLLTPSSGSVLLPSTSGSGDTATGSIEDASAMFVSLKETELLSKMTTGGLQVQNS